MNFSRENARAKKVWFDENNLWLALVDGRQLSVPRMYFPRLDAGGGAGYLRFAFCHLWGQL